MTLPWAAAALATIFAQQPARSTPPPRPDNPFSHLITNLAADARAIASPDTLLVLVAGGAGALAVHNSNDQRTYDWVKKQTPTSTVADLGNVMGNEAVQSGASLAVWIAGRATQNVKAEALGADLIRAHVLNGVVTTSLKYATQRQRPSGSNLSFPSGHTSSSFTTAAVIQNHYGLLAALPAYAVGGVVAYARIRTNHHWLSDTVFGATIGIVAGRAATRHNAGAWTVTPVKTPGGVAVYVTRTSTSRTASPARR